MVEKGCIVQENDPPHCQASAEFVTYNMQVFTGSEEQTGTCEPLLRDVLVSEACSSRSEMDLLSSHRTRILHGGWPH